MSVRRAVVAAALFCSSAGVAQADSYPTVDRVQYVLECMKDNGGRYDFLYKCSCVIDAVARALPYERYVDAAAIARYQGMAGERMGEFRDPEGVRAEAARYRAILAEAKRECDVPR